MRKVDIRVPDNYKLLREEDNQPVSVDEGDNSIPEAVMEKLKNEKVYIMYSNYLSLAQTNGHMRRSKKLAQGID